MAEPTEEEVNRIVVGVNEANDASNFADTVVFEPELINETRYKYILTNAPDQRY